MLEDVQIRVIDIVRNKFMLIIKNAGSNPIFYFGQGVLGSFLVLFIFFYRRAYVAKQERKRAKGGKEQ